MTIVESVVLGAVQGLTEFIPVSSSGHVVLAQQFMSGASDHLFVEWINFGTVLALLIYFRKRIAALVTDVVKNKQYRLAGHILLACVPAGFAGFVLAGIIEQNSFFNNVSTVVIALAIVGIIMIVLEKLPRLSAVETLNHLSWGRALTIGCAQVVALIPGTSRSGSTIIAGRLTGLNRGDAAEFSFLISIPIMLGVIAKLLVTASGRTYLTDNLPTLLLANAVACLTGLFAVGFMMRFLKKNSLAPFGWYRVGLAIAVGLFFLVQ